MNQIHAILIFTILLSFSAAKKYEGPSTDPLVQVVEEPEDEAPFITEVEEPSEAYLELKDLTQDGKADIRYIWSDLEHMCRENRDYMKEGLFASGNALTKAALSHMNIRLAMALEQLSQRLDIPRSYQLMELRYKWAQEIFDQYGRRQIAGRRRLSANRRA